MLRRRSFARHLPTYRLPAGSPIDQLPLGTVTHVDGSINACKKQNPTRRQQPDGKETVSAGQPVRWTRITADRWNEIHSFDRRRPSPIPTATDNRKSSLSRDAAIWASQGNDASVFRADEPFDGWTWYRAVEKHPPADAARVVRFHPTNETSPSWSDWPVLCWRVTLTVLRRLGIASVVLTTGDTMSDAVGATAANGPGRLRFSCSFFLSLSLSLSLFPIFRFVFKFRHAGRSAIPPDDGDGRQSGTSFRFSFPFKLFSFLFIGSDQRSRRRSDGDIVAPRSCFSFPVGCRVFRRTECDGGRIPVKQPARNSTENVLSDRTATLNRKEMSVSTAEARAWLHNRSRHLSNDSTRRS